jgi:hypothetical protein
MNKAEEKQESPPILVDTKRCYRCKGRFGLARRTFALKQFCSNRCLQQYKADAARISLIKEWREYFSRKP